MEMELMGKDETRIKCTLKSYHKYRTVIDSYIRLYGGEEESRNRRFIYFIIHADLLNRKKRGGNGAAVHGVRKQGAL